jgi:hypothetical protein
MHKNRWRQVNQRGWKKKHANSCTNSNKSNWGKAYSVKNKGGICMRKNILVLGAILLVLLLAIPMVFAEDTNDLDTNTIQEIKTLTRGEGAHIRLLQLEKHISRNILIGDKTIEILKKNHPGIDTNNLAAIVDQLDALLSDVQAVDASLNTTTDMNTLAQQYVELKKEAIDLTKQFREAVRGQLSSQDKQEIKQAIRFVDENELQDIKEQIKEKVLGFNATQVETILKAMGASNPELIQKIQDGNTTPQEIRTAIKNAYNALSAEQKAAVESVLKEGILKRTIKEKQLVDDAKQNMRERMQERVQNRLEKLQEWAEKRSEDLNEKGFEWRAKRMENISDRIQKIQEWIEKKLADRNSLPPRGPGRMGPRPDRNEFPPFGPDENTPPEGPPQGPGPGEDGGDE